MGIDALQLAGTAEQAEGLSSCAAGVVGGEGDTKKPARYLGGFVMSWRVSAPPQFLTPRSRSGP